MGSSFLMLWWGSGLCKKVSNGRFVQLCYVGHNEGRVWEIPIWTIYWNIFVNLFL